MNLPNTTELGRLQSAQAETLPDSCKIGVRTEVTSGIYTTQSFAYSGSEIACGFNDRARREVQDGSQARVLDAELRLPFGTSITAANRIKMTKRWGVALSPEVEYAVFGPPHVGPSGIVLNLAIAEGNTPK